MKRLIKSFLIFTFFIIIQPGMSYSQNNAQLSSVYQSNVKKVELAVTGMSCQKGCADGIDKKLNMTYGIVKSKTYFEKEKSVITYDPAIISVPEIIKIIKDKGYEAKLLTKKK
jgi:copper chaperone